NVIQNSREDAAISEIQQAYSAASLYQMQEDKETFTLGDVIKGEFFKESASWDKGKVGNDFENVTFKQDGAKMSITIPDGALRAGTKKSKVQNKLEDPAKLTRSQLFGGTSTSSSSSPGS